MCGLVKEWAESGEIKRVRLNGGTVKASKGVSL